MLRDSPCLHSLVEPFGHTPRRPAPQNARQGGPTGVRRNAPNNPASLTDQPPHPCVGVRRMRLTPGWSFGRFDEISNLVENISDLTLCAPTTLSTRVLA